MYNNNRSKGKRPREGGKERERKHWWVYHLDIQGESVCECASVCVRGVRERERLEGPSFKDSEERRKREGEQNREQRVRVGAL